MIKKAPKVMVGFCIDKKKTGNKKFIVITIIHDKVKTTKDQEIKA